MKNNMYHNLPDPDLDCESKEGMNRFRRRTDDYYDDIWQEMIVIDVTALKYQREFENVCKIINPKQAAAIYWHSSIDAEEAMRPLDRMHEILKVMRRSDYLSKYDINDFQEFKAMIENIDPFAFYVFTETLYKTNMILFHGLGNSEPLSALEEQVESLKNITIKN